ncbi:hypothetical protein NECID01_0504 [Nematocida sp. AWRm77]|nr:hypothetical protein NECID01_0504 [Nematocida sp. AWRm77]
MKKRQTYYRERGQPAERSKLGPLEKNRHFLKRSKQEKEREERIQKIKKLAEESNPEEFQFFMYKYKKVGHLLVRKDKKSTLSEKEKALISLPEEEKPAQKSTLPKRIVFTE